MDLNEQILAKLAEALQDADVTPNKAAWIEARMGVELAHLTEDEDA